MTWVKLPSFSEGKNLQPREMEALGQVSAAGEQLYRTQATSGQPWLLKLVNTN